MRRYILRLLVTASIGGVVAASILSRSPSSQRDITGSDRPVKKNPSPEIEEERRRLYAESNRLLLEARAFLNAGDLARAEQAARRAREATPVYRGERRPLSGLSFLKGDIALRRGDYRKALEHYRPPGQKVWRSGRNSDVALCYVRLGDYPSARRYYADEFILRYSSDVTPADLPGTRTARSLEASILTTRGAEAYASRREAEAFADLEAAARLAPKSAAAQYFAGLSLVRLKRDAEARPYFERAAEWGSAGLAEAARQKTRARMNADRLRWEKRLAEIRRDHRERVAAGQKRLTNPSAMPGNIACPR